MHDDARFLEFGFGDLVGQVFDLRGIVIRVGDGAYHEDYGLGVAGVHQTVQHL